MQQENTPCCFGMQFSGYDEQMVDEVVARKTFDQIATVNAEFIVKYHSGEAKFKQIIDHSVCTMDGQIPLFMAKVLGENCTNLKKVAGSGYTAKLMEQLPNSGLRVFLLGGSENSINGMIAKYQSGDLLEGYSPPIAPYPFADEENRRIKEKIKQHKPDVVLVAFGAGKQEYWSWDNREFLKELGVRTVIGVGGTFEMLSGQLGRAPDHIHKMGLESLYRFYQEPSLYRIKRILKAFGVFRYALKR